MISLTLTDLQFMEAAAMGAYQQVRSFGRVGRNQQDTALRGWQDSIQGSIGEYTLALWLGIPYAGCIDVFRSRPDVGIYEVRATGHKYGRLLVRKHEDFDDTIYILVRQSRLPIVDIVGWMYGHECNRPEYLKALEAGRDPAYVIDNHLLHDMETLPEKCTLLI